MSKYGADSKYRQTTLGQDSFGHRFKVFGNDSGDYILWDNVNGRFLVQGKIGFDADSDNGNISWNASTQTLDVILSNNVTANLPTEQLLPLCVNKTGTDIPNGTPVIISGSQGNKPTIVVADASSYATSSKTIGMTTEDIADNNTGFVCRAGYVRDIDTSSWTEGTFVYLDTTAGSISSTKPSTANGENTICLGVIIYQHATQGIVCIKIMPDKDWWGDLDGGDYSYFKANGVYVSKGASKMWNDLQFTVSGGKVPAANFPTYETFTTNTKEYAFSVDDFLYLGANELPHGTDLTVGGLWHVHIANKTANATGASRFVKIQIIIAYAALNGAWSESTFTGEVEIPNGTAALTSLLVTLDSDTFDISSIGLGSQIIPTLKRITATGGTEYADDVYITQVGLHHRLDQLGSSTIGTK